MGTVTARKRLETIERDVLSSMFVGVLSKDEAWLEHTLNETLPALEERALRLAGECREKGECAGDDQLCDEARIRDLFAKTREKLQTEHVARESMARFPHR
jgi:hypothetical protein